MNKLVEEIIKPFLTETPAPKITKVIGVYGGRFQPFGPHHLKTYKWLEKQVDEAYITTSNIKKPPRHPMNFREKVRRVFINIHQTFIKKGDRQRMLERAGGPWNMLEHSKFMYFQQTGYKRSEQGSLADENSEKRCYGSP